MMFIINTVLVSLMICGGTVLVYLTVNYFKRFNQFVDYLLSIGDRETLQKIGRLDGDGKRVYRGVRYHAIHARLTEKYEETRDEEYLIFDDYNMGYVRLSTILFVILFVLFAVYMIIHRGS